MSEPRVVHNDEIEGAHGGVFKPVGRTLGATAFGVSLEQFPQGHAEYPDHDHAKDGQEEVYFVISGQATLTIDGNDHVMRPGSIAYVPPGHSRRFTMPDESVRFLAIGGTPGAPFTDVIAARETGGDLVASLSAASVIHTSRVLPADVEDERRRDEGSVQAVPATFAGSMTPCS